MRLPPLPRFSWAWRSGKIGAPSIAGRLHLRPQPITLPPADFPDPLYRLRRPRRPHLNRPELIDRETRRYRGELTRLALVEIIAAVTEDRPEFGPGSLPDLPPASLPAIDAALTALSDQLRETDWRRAWRITDVRHRYNLALPHRMGGRSEISRASSETTSGQSRVRGRETTEKRL